MLKRNWTEIDNHARKADESVGSSFKTLKAYLGEPLKRFPDKDVYMARGLLQWLQRASSQKGSYGKDSPNWIAKSMFAQDMAFADGYKKLCDNCDVKCEIVIGVSKTGQYRPGDIEVEREKMQARWNKVFLMGKWWPVYPRWVLRAVKRPAAPGDPSSEKTEVTFTDFWFLTDPELFIHKCYPDQIEDQMLPVAKQVKKPRMFMKLPYLTAVFHDNGLRMTSEEMCVVEAIKGVCRISFKVGRNKGKNFVIDFKQEDLKITNLKDSDCSQKIKDAVKDIDTSQLVFYSRKKNHFMVDIRCPIEAAYHLSIRGGIKGEKSYHVLMKTKIVCREKMPDFQPFPANAGDVGWGFGPHALKAGLIKSDKKEPKLLVEPKGEEVDLKITFEMDKAVVGTEQFEAQLSSSGKTTDDLKDYVKVVQDGKCLSVEMKSPAPGEYTLSVLAKTPGSTTPSPICRYFLTTLEEVEKLEDEYYDSSDGTSDLDEELGELETELDDLTKERDKLRALIASRQSMRK